MTDTQSIALITDAVHFIGKPGSRSLLSRGWQVFAVDDSFTDDAARAAFEDEVAGAVALAPAQPQELIDAVVDRAGHLTCLICNDSHPADPSPLGETSPEILTEALERLTVRPFAMINAAVPHLKERGYGKIVLLSSAAPLQGIPNYSVYATARGATNAMTRTMALELGKHNITVNAMAANFVESPTYFPDDLLNDPKVYERITSRIPLRRLSKPEEAGEVVAFLAGPESDFITGHVLPYAGGWA
ncbi:MAG: SDR family oxidoreductase [Alphaproteobacteria bacterium]